MRSARRAGEESAVPGWIPAQAYETLATCCIGRRHIVCTRRDIDRVAAHACPERSRRIVSLDHLKAKKM